MRLRPPLPLSLVQILGLAVAYAVAVRLAWALPVRSGLVAVWPAAGVALGATLRWGPRLWPGVLLGAFAVKITTSGLVASIGGALGPTVEVLLCVWLFNCAIRPLMTRPAVGRFAGL